MKYTLIIIPILFFVNCGITTKKLPAEKIPVFINETEKIEEEDSVILISESFELNDMLCHWEHIIDNNGFVILKLKDSKTNKILLEYNTDTNYYFRSGIDFDEVIASNNMEGYFENFDLFEDFNFNGFKDFHIRSYGSMPMTSMTAIFLFNNKTKQFEYSEALSDNHIEEIDSINKTLTTSNFNMQNVFITKHYFDEFGNIKFTELTTEGTETEEKIINGEVVEEYYDTFSFEGYIRQSEYLHFQKEFFPFDFKNYSTKKLMSYFYKEVIVDSIVYSGNTELATSPYKLYTYRFEDSYISFFVKDADEYFYVVNADIKKDLFKSKNGIGIGISDDDFCLKINIPPQDYEHFTISEGDKETSYNFDFEDGFLRHMSVYGEY